MIDHESDVHMTSFPLMSRVRVVFSLLSKVPFCIATQMTSDHNFAPFILSNQLVNSYLDDLLCSG